MKIGQGVFEVTECVKVRTGVELGVGRNPMVEEESDEGEVVGLAKT